MSYAEKYIDLLPLYLKSDPKLKAWLSFLGEIIDNYDSVVTMFLKLLSQEATPVLVGHKYISQDPQYTQVEKYGFREALRIISSWFGFSREFTVIPRDQEDSPFIITLSDRGMERIIRTKLWRLGFDGSRRTNLENITRIFGSSQSLQISLYNNISHQPATANMLLLASSEEVFDLGTEEGLGEDAILWQNGYYNNEVLGINYLYNAVNINTLVYDASTYDEEKIYDGQVY